MEKIQIMLCGNENVFRGMLLTLLSVARHTERPLDVFIGTMSLTDIDERYKPISDEMAEHLRLMLKRRNPESELRLLDFGESFRRELISSPNMGTSYTPYTMIRLFADEAEQIGCKLLYLDTDVVALGDISELWDMDVDGYYMAGARDYIGKMFFGAGYLNAGVLLFNMKKMRADGIFVRARELCAKRRMLLLDQAALNKYAKRKLILNRRFNEQKKTSADTLLRHFSMTVRWFPYFHTQTVKPWQRELVHNVLGDRAFDDLYLEYDKLVEELNLKKTRV